MKKITLLLLTVCLGLISYSQQRTIAIAPTIFNILYVGVDNPLDIAVEGINNEDLNVTVTGGTIRKSGHGGYYVNVRKAGTARICLSADGKSLGCKDFRCKLLEDPVAYIIPNNYSGTIHKSQLLSIGTVNTKQNSFFDVRFVVISFSLSAEIGGFLEVQKSKSNKFTDKQKDIIRRMNVGSKVFIEDIRCVGPDGSERKLNDIVLTVR